MKFNDLKVTGKAESTRDCEYWYCVCWCGNTRKVEERKLLRDEVPMCVGCEARAKMEKFA